MVRVFLLVLLLCSTAYADDMKVMSAILYGEAANDPLGWLPKLNTYNLARKPGESLCKAMKRKSSAYQNKSEQFKKAFWERMTEYEVTVIVKIRETIKNFKPDPNWKYTFHENFAFYKNEEEALKHLKKVWGDKVDYASKIQIGKEVYFKSTDTQRINKRSGKFLTK